MSRRQLYFYVFVIVLSPIFCSCCPTNSASSSTANTQISVKGSHHHSHHRHGNSAKQSRFEVNSNQEIILDNEKVHNFRYLDESQNKRNLMDIHHRSRRRTTTSTNSTPSTFRIGFVFPAFATDTDGKSTTDNVDNDGIQYLAAFLLAVKHINNKTDGRWDDFLPNSKLEVVIRDTTGPFTNDIECAIYQTTKAFNGSGIHSAVGASTNAASDAIAQIYNEYQINQVAYGSTGSFLSYVEPYPYYYRTIMDDAYQGYAIADIMFKAFGYSKVSTFSTTNTLGTDGFLQFSTRADELGIEIVSIHQFRPKQADLSVHIHSALEQGTRIFFVFMAAQDFANLMTQGYKKGLFKAGTFVFGNDKILSNEAWSYFDSSVDVQEVMRGVFALNQSTSFSSIYYDRFVSDWMAQNDTIVDKDTTSETCHNNEKDDDGNFLLYKKKNSKGVYKCTGIEFSKVTSSSQIAPVAYFVYDSVLVLAKAIGELYAVHNYVEGESMYNYETFGDILGYVITNNLTLTGITGNIQFRLGDSTGYGFGDREVGTKLAVLNFQPSHYCSTTKEGGPVTIATWDNAVGYVPCTNDCTIIYSTSDNSAPTQKPPPIINTMAIGLQSAIIVMGVVCVLQIVICFVFLYYNSSLRLVRSFQPVMLSLFLSGGVFSCMRQFVGGSEVSTASCHMKVWFGHLAFAFAFMSLCVKTWRVHMIVNNTTMKRVKISNDKVVRIVFAIVFMFSIYLIIYSAAGRPDKIDYIQDLGKLQDLYTPVCVATYDQFATTLYVLEGFLLIAGGRYCWLTRDVPDSINDSKSISLATYVIIFISAIVFCLVFLITLDGNVKETIVCFGFAFATLSSVSFMFIPKMLMIWEGADLDSKMQIYYPNGRLGKNRNKKVVAGDETDISDIKDKDGQSVLSGFLDVTKLDINSRTKRVQNIAICKEQVKKWTALMKDIESRLLLDSNSKSNSRTSGATNSQVAQSSNDPQNGETFGITADKYMDNQNDDVFEEGDDRHMEYGGVELDKEL